MKKIWIASDCTEGRMYETEENLKPMEISRKFGRGEAGEIIHIWDDGNTDNMPDHMLYWDSRKRKYTPYTI